jgi:FemAB-related protein (PEP-CTERM system-associated)
MSAMPGTAGLPLRVSEAGDADRADWQAYTDAHPEASFCHRWEWRALMAEQWRHRPIYLIARRGEAVCGVLPLAHMRTRLFGSQLVSLPFCVYGGPIANDPAALAALDEAAQAQAQACGAGHLEYRNRRPLHPDWPGSDLYAAFEKPLLADEQANLLAIPRKQRAMVRKGMAAGLRATIEDADRFHPVYADNVHRHGTPAMPRSWFRALQASFGEDCDVMVVRDPAGHAVSAVMSFWHRGTAMPYYAGDLPVARALAANDFKYWRLMVHALERGCTRFDFGRSKVGTGPWHFKRNWGFEPQPLAYEYRLITRSSVPQNNPNNPRYRLLIDTWRRLPRPLVDWLGPRIVRGLG